MAEIVLTADNFEEKVLKADKPVLVDFWATWCMPCRMLAPLVSQIAEEKAGSLYVGKVDVDEQGELAAQFHIASIPTLLFMKDGKPVKTVVGYHDLGALTRVLEEIGA